MRYRLKKQKCKVEFAIFAFFSCVFDGILITLQNLIKNNLSSTKINITYESEKSLPLR